jgi:hypothetical protein
MAAPMTDYQTFPPAVLAKVAAIDAHCLDLTAKLECARRELSALRQELRDLTPRVAHDEFSANREYERLTAERARLTDAITAQTASCERLERRLHAEERTVASCKRWLHELPAGARLRVVEGHGGDLDDIRARIKAVKDEIARVQALPVPAADLAGRIKRYVDGLAAKARPVIQGIGEGETLRVLYPLNENANRTHLSAFAPHDGNALLLMALVDGDRLAERLLQIATDTGISASERDQRLSALRLEETRLRYAEEAAVGAAIANGDEASRSASAPAWAVLQVEIEHELAAAA